MDHATCRAGPIAKVDKEIFSLGAPMRGNCDFDAGAGGPTSLGRVANGVVGEVRLDIAEGGAAGAVDEKTVESVTGAAARRDEPSVLGQATSRTEAGAAVVVKVPKPLESAQSPSASTPNTHEPTW